MHCLPGRRLQWLGNRESVDNPLPLDFGLLEIHQKTDGTAGGPQIVEALGSVLAGERVHAFQFHHQGVFHQDVGKVFPHTVALINYWKGSFGGCRDAAKAEFSEESALVNLLEEAGTQGARDLKDSTQHALCQRIQDIESKISAFIGFYRRLIIVCRLCAKLSRKIP